MKCSSLKPEISAFAPVWNMPLNATGDWSTATGAKTHIFGALKSPKYRGLLQCSSYILYIPDWSNWSSHFSSYRQNHPLPADKTDTVKKRIDLVEVAKSHATQHDKEHAWQTWKWRTTRLVISA